MQKMRKLVVLLAAVMILVLSTSTVAFAAGSPEVIDLSKINVIVRDVPFNTEYQQPYAKVKLGDTYLTKGRDWKITSSTQYAVGKYTVTIEGIGKYKGLVKTLTWNITKADPVVTQTKTTVKASKVNTCKQVVQFTSEAKHIGGIHYSVVSYPSGGKSYVSIDYTGKVTFKRGAPKGTYKFKVTYDKNWNSKTMTITIK